jgi:hypothetical protein
MTEQGQPIAAVEHAYELIAAGIDTAGAQRSELFLAKLSLTLAALLADEAKLAYAVEVALKDL